jgi:hypothetical protein
MAFGYGLGWPYFVVKYFVDKKEEQTTLPEMDQRRQRILGDGPTHGSVPSSSEGPVGKIRDPFEMG